MPRRLSYKAIVVQKETYLLELARYVVFNPVRAGMVRAANDYPWSSYRAMLNPAAGPQWLETRVILAAFGEEEAGAVRRYRRFVAKGKGRSSPWAQLKRQIFLGSDAFVDAMQRRASVPRDLREVPQARPRPKALPLHDYAHAQPTRDDAIRAAYASGAYTMREVGDHFGLHYSRVSKIVRAAATPGKKERGKT